ncbi:MAG: hypothetical protein DRQ44_03235 [Gammaproteobacteria bacterium]|nr:MAG: hypothetical protein DRQ44_03235 [Gammaproteobacteria bacterium]
MFKSTITPVYYLSSLKLSFAAMAALLFAVLFSYFEQNQPVLWIALPLLVLAVNLLAAIAVNPRIRQNSGLLIFHICLLALVLLAALAQLTSMKGRVEIVQGQVFDSEQVTVVQRGPWHSLQALKQLRFAQGDIQVDYTENLRRGATRSQLTVNGESFVVGDNRAFFAHGYRFYTTSNKGYAAMLSWFGENGQSIQGAIHFPSYPLYDWKQDNQWLTPAGQLLKMKLISSKQTQPDNSWQLDSRKASGSLQIELASGKQQTLNAGQRIEFQGGVLEFVEVRMWMGYSIYYNPWLAWFFAASIVGVFGLAWHFYLKLGPRKLPLRDADSVRSGRATPAA